MQRNQKCWCSSAPLHSYQLFLWLEKSCLASVRVNWEQLCYVGRVAVTTKGKKKRSIRGSRLKLSILSSWGNYVLTLYFQIHIRPVHNIKDSVPKLQLWIWVVSPLAIVCSWEWKKLHQVVVFAVKVQVILHSTELWLEGLVMKTDPFTRRSLIQFQIKIIVITLSSKLKVGFYCPFKPLSSVYFDWISRFQAAW